MNETERRERLESGAYPDEESFLADYDRRLFDGPLYSVDPVIFTIVESELRVLLVRRSSYPFKDVWALPGGFVDLARDTDIEATARRKLAEKTGFDAPYLEQVQTVGEARRDPRGFAVTTVYFALLPAKGVSLSAGSGASEVRWATVPLKELMAGLAFDHARLIALAQERLRNKARYTLLPAFLLPQPFPLRELRSVYAAILGEGVDYPNLRRRALSSGMLQECGKATQGYPAAAYRLRPEAAQFVFDRTLETS